MRKLLSIAWLDFKMGFSDKSEFVFFLVLPIAFTLILAAAMGGGSSEGDNRYPLAVVDQDRSALSAQLIGALGESDVVRPVTATRDEAATMLDKSRVVAALTIPAGFGNTLMAGLPVNLAVGVLPNDTRALAAQQSVSAAAEEMSNAVIAANVSLDEAMQIKPFSDSAAKQAYYQQAMSAAQELLKNPPARTQITQSPKVTRDSISSAELSSIGQLITWVSIPLIGVAVTFIDEKRLGTLRRMLTMPVTKATILGGKIAGRLTHGVVQMALLILFGVLVMKVNWGRSPLALAGMALTFALACVAFGVLLGTLAKTSSQANWLAISTGMLMSALGGAWWPMEITPKLYQQVVKVLPTTWAMSGFTDVVVRGQGVSSVLPEMGILLAFAALFFGIGIWRLRYN